MNHFRMGKWAWVMAAILTFVFASGIAWASGLPLSPISPAMTLSGNEIRIGDPSAPNVPVSVLSKQEPKQISETNLGELTILKGYGASDVRAVEENLENSGVQIEYREPTFIDDF